MYQSEESVCITNFDLKRISYFIPVFLEIIQTDHNQFHKFWNQSFYPINEHHNFQVQQFFNCQSHFCYYYLELVLQFLVSVVNLFHQFHVQAFYNQLLFIFLKPSLNLNHHKGNVRLQELIICELDFQILVFYRKKYELMSLTLI